MDFRILDGWIPAFAGMTMLSEPIPTHVEITGRAGFPKERTAALAGAPAVRQTRKRLNTIAVRGANAARSSGPGSSLARSHKGSVRCLALTEVADVETEISPHKVPQSSTLPISAPPAKTGLKCREKRLHLVSGFQLWLNRILLIGPSPYGSGAVGNPGLHPEAGFPECAPRGLHPPVSAPNELVSCIWL